MRLHSLFIFFALVLGHSSVFGSAFGDMLSGFWRCQFRDVYVDILTKEPVHPYFVERSLRPCEISNGMAYFCVDESYFGLPVYKLMIPAKTFDIHAVFIDLPLAQSRKVLSARFGSEFSSGAQPDIGEAPVLLADPAAPGKSILMCSPPEGL